MPGVLLAWTAADIADLPATPGIPGLERPLLATDKVRFVGEAVAMRETSVIFAALIGWAVLREPVGPARAGLMALIAAGAALVQIAA